MAQTTVTIAGYTYEIPSITRSTNLGPLPTTSFPADCLGSLWDLNTFGLGVPWTYETQGCAVSTCCPNGNFYTEPFAWMSSYYSPGVCPSQYRSCSAPPPPTALSTEDGETIVFCCPTNYACPVTTSDDVYLFCQSLLSTSTWVVVLDDIFHQSTVSTRLLVLPTEYSSYQLAYPIQVRSRLGETVPVTVSASVTPRSSGSSASNSHSLATENTVASSKDDELPSGTIAGIAVGAVAGLVLLVGGLIWSLRLRHRRNKTTIQTASAGPEANKDGQTWSREREYIERQDRQQSAELAAQQLDPYEIDGRGKTEAGHATEMSTG